MTLTVPAFSRPFKLLALLIVAASGSWMYQLFTTGQLAPNHTLSPSNGLIWLLCGWLLMVFTLVSIYRSQTTLTEHTLKQTWIWDKEVALPELVYAKLIRLKGLDWLIAPRLYVRTVMGKFMVFYAADKTMVTEFQHLVRTIERRA
ncbi:MAG: hypothetical protein QM533_03610 [Cytophagales bacterium]|nr:hypothetical protein [Cytophagales bacterium]